MTTEENVPLAPMTTFGLGGRARFLVRAQTVEEVRVALTWAISKKLPYFVLGGGSNSLFNDTDFDGLIIKIESRGITKEDNTIVAMAGESWDDVVLCAVQSGLWGLENLSGIPGQVGGAVVQNVGAYGSVVGDTIQWIEVYDSKHGVVKILTTPECLFGYRDSVFKHEEGRYVVLRAAFTLSVEAKPNLAYRDVAAGVHGKDISLLTVRDTILEIRKEKFPDIAKEGTAGSFFKNPIFSSQEAATLQSMHPTMPLFSIPDTAGVKIPLAWIFDKVLHLKGLAVGGARVFEKQPLVLVASRGAKASEVRALANTIKEIVRAHLHIEIEEEVKIISSE